jgi:hypothetical protein
MSTKDSKPTITDKGITDPLSSFLASVDRFTQDISAQMTTAAGEGEDHLVIQSTAESFVAQTRRLTDYIREAAVGIAPAQRNELHIFLRVQDGEALVNRALDVAKKVLSPGAPPVTLGLLDWIDEVMATLKKIISEIWELIFHTKPPEWLITILQIIDELLNLLKTIFGTRFGFRASQLADEFSRREVNFLREMTALAALRAARMSGRNADDEVSS